MTKDEREKLIKIPCILMNFLRFRKKKKYLSNTIISKYIIIIVIVNNNGVSVPRQWKEMSFLFHYWK